MSAAPERVVFDCNVFFQALINRCGPAGGCVTAAIEGRAALYCNSRIIAELRDVASRPAIRAKFASLTDERVALQFKSRFPSLRIMEPQEFLHHLSLGVKQTPGTEPNR